MKIFKYFAVLLLVFTLSPMLCSAEAADTKDTAAGEPGFFARLFGAEEKKPLTPPEPWDRKLIYNEEEAVKAEEKPCWVAVAARAVGIYLANVGSDFLDILSVEVSVGNTFALDFHVTRMLDFGLENTDAYFAGTGQLRHFVAGRREAQRVAALCWSYEDIYVSQTAGELPSYTMKDTSFNLVRCYTDAFKDRDIDYLGIGAKAAMFVGIAVDFHAAAIPDFLYSLVGFDLYGDNWK